MGVWERMPPRSHLFHSPSSFTQRGQWLSRRCPYCVQYAAGRTPPHYSGHEGAHPSGGK